MLELLANAAHETAGAAEHHAEPTAFGLGPGGFVALAMVMVFVIMWRAGVHKTVAGILDQRIAEIRKQLDEAASLRAEAQKLRDEYAARAKQADAEIADIRAAAEKQAADIVEQAKADAAALIERHKALSAEKIAAAERAAVEELRAKAASAAAAAARGLIADTHDAKADSKLVDQSISSI